ncbi:MAG: heavy-metal-associated domain-containing protein [Bacteroidota bacterium]
MTKHTFKSLLVILGLGLFVFACQSNQEKVATEVVYETSYKEVEGDVAKTYANFSIEGMSCAQACGSSISKCVKGVDGVIASEMDFNKERAVDSFEITYDPEKTDEKQIAEAIGKLYDGAYQVKSVEVVTVLEVEVEESEAETVDETTIALKEFRLPNLSDIFENLLR